MTRDEAEVFIAEQRRNGLTMQAIANAITDLGVPMSKSAVIGIIDCKYPELQGESIGVPRTLYDRCAALHCRMDEVPADFRRNRSRYYIAAPQRMWITDGKHNQMVLRTASVPPGWNVGRAMMVK
jgi:hypothetical protein